MNSRILSALFLVFCCAGAGFAQTPPAASSVVDLPAQKLGPGDLISVQVFNFPEFSRPARVAADGTIRIPLVPKPIPAAGKLPLEVEAEVTEALAGGELVVNPVVTVTVIEYISRPITVSGAVKGPVIFQAIGRVTLLDAIIRAGGLTPEAGPEILVTPRPRDSEPEGRSSPTRHINARQLLNEDGNAANIVLAGGEEIRVPPAGKVYVVGDVKAPGAFAVTDNSDTTILKVLSLSGGVGPYYSREAYIIRRDEVTATKHRISIPLKDILMQKVPDFPLLADDIFFVPDDTKRRQTAAVLERLATYGAALASGLIIYSAAGR